MNTNLKVDAEFRDKIPPLTEDEFRRLEENIVADGAVREPLVVWNGTIIDGHHRWAIIQKHPEIPYTVKEMDFSDRWAAIAWMCGNQLGRRNVTDEQRTYLLGKLYEARKNTQGGDRRSSEFSMVKKQTDEVSNDQSGHLKKLTRTGDKIAKEYGVGYGTVQRAEHFAKGLDEAEKVSEGFRGKVLSGEVKAPKSTIAELRKLDGEELKEAVEEIKAPKPKPTRKPNYADGDTRKTYQRIRELSQDMADIGKPKSYTIDNAVNDLEALEDNFLNQINFVLDTRGEVINENEETKEKVAAFFEGAIHDLQIILKGFMK